MYIVYRESHVLYFYRKIEILLNSIINGTVYMKWNSIGEG